MKRTNLIIDEQLLKEAKRLLGAESYSEAVNQALAQTVKLAHIRSLTDLFGTGVWSGDLGAMRDDQRPGKPRRGRRA